MSTLGLAITFEDVVVESSFGLKLIVGFNFYKL